MRIFRLIFAVFATPVTAIAGIWIGGQIRFKLTGEETASIHFVHTTESGLKMDSYPVNTKFIPALLFSLFGKPRWFFAFLGGVLASLWIDDHYEALFMERFIAPMVENRLAATQENNQQP